MKDDVILRLNSDKLQLEQEVVGLKERLSKKAEKQVKSGKQSAEHQQRTSWRQNHKESTSVTFITLNSLCATQELLMHNYEREFKALKIQMEAEGNKTEKMEEMIKGLSSNKVQLEQEVAHLKELLAQKAEKHTSKGKQTTGQQWQKKNSWLHLNQKFWSLKEPWRKHLFLDEIIEDKDCPLPPMDGYPECQGKLKVM